MCDLTVVNPTKDPFNIGQNINQPCVIEDKIAIAYDEIGSGTVQTYVATALAASGSYGTLGATGTWSISLSQNADETWTVGATLSGSGAGYDRYFTATCAQTSSNPPALTFSDTGTSDNVVLSQDNGSAVTDGKIQFNPSWAPVSIYLDSNV